MMKTGPWLRSIGAFRRERLRSLAWAALIPGLAILYVASFYKLYAIFGLDAIDLGILLVAAVGIRSGWRLAIVSVGVVLAILALLTRPLGLPLSDVFSLPHVVVALLIGIAFGSARDLLRSLRAQHQEAVALSAAAWAVAVGANDERLIDAVLETASSLVRCDAAAVFRPVDGDWLECVGSAGAKLVGTRLPRTASIVGRCATTKRADVVGDVRSDPDYTFLWSEERSLVHVPLLIGEHVAGVLLAMGRTVDQFDAADVERLTALAPHVAVALRLTDQLDEVRKDRGTIQLILDNAPIMLYALDEHGVFTMSEGSGLAKLGLRPGQVVGSSAFDLFAGQPESLAPVRSALAGTDMRTTVTGPGWVFDATHFPVHDSAGRVTGVVGVAIDVSDRERALTRLRLVESAVEQVGDGILIRDAEPDDGVVRYVNPAFARLVGRAAEDIVGLPFSSLEQVIAADASSAVECRATIARGETCEGEAVLRRDDGSSTTVEVQVAPVRDATGRTVSVVSIWHDITERIKAHAEHIRRTVHVEQLRRLSAAAVAITAERASGERHDELLKLVVSHARSVTSARYAALSLSDAQGRIVDFVTDGMDPDAQDRIGEPPVGHGVLGVLRRERHPIRLADIAQHPESVGFPAHHPPMRSLLGVPIQWRGSHLGELYVAEKDGAVEFTPADAEAVLTLAEHAAIAIENARLNDALSAASQAKSVFLATMSHELRTPLNAVLGFSQLLAEQLSVSLTQGQQRYLWNIREAGTHLLELVNDVLQISRLDAGKLELRPDLVMLDVLLEPVIDAMRESALAKGITFEASTAGSEGVVLDTTRVREVLFNLLSNAFKFTPPGGAVTLRVELDEDDLLIEVADTGIGIPRDAHERVFGMFERMHEGSATVAGTGLGLAITKRFVELHGGTITFASEEGHGATFRVRLPGVRSRSIAGEGRVTEDDAYPVG